jgi:translation initiation factor 6
LAVYLASIVGSPSIGVYALATDKFVIVPKMVPQRKAEQVAAWLKVKLVHTSVCGSVLVGAFACANSHGIVLPSFVRDDEVAAIKALFDGNVGVMETKKTAYGNMVLVNDRGAVVDRRLRGAVVRQLSDVLGVEAVQGEIAGLPYVGSLAVATNRGVLAHPLLKEEERWLLQDVLKVQVEVGTVNCGIPYVGTGLVANSNAAVAGSMTTGPEMFIIGNALDVVRDDV